MACVELGLRADAAPLQFGCAIEVGLRLVALRLLRRDSRIQRLHLQGELLIGDDGDLRAGRDDIAFLDREGGDRAADARPRDKLMNRFDRRDDGFPVGDFGRAHDELSAASARGDAEAGRKSAGARRIGQFSERRLDLYISDCLN